MKYISSKNRSVFAAPQLFVPFLTPVERNSDVDLIIVGQGLAGSAVAIRALVRGYKIMVFDQPDENFVKTWLADQIFPALRNFYEETESLTNRKFFYPMPVYRPFASVEEQNEWMGKSADEQYVNYVRHFFPPGNFDPRIIDPFGGMTLNQSGYLDTRSYLEAVRDYLTTRSAFRNEIFQTDALAVHEQGVRYQNIAARKIVFCQGVENRSNPWFNRFRVNSLKGEFINVQCDWRKDVILNRGVYVVPGSEEGEWRVGATYNWNDETPDVTTWARTELSGKLEELLQIPYTITGQQCGVRPTTRDRKPIIGAHPDYQSMIIFNGLGTKGVSLAPYFSEVLIRWMENKGTIEKEADVSRFN
jgi:glycine/D-amino acid oxidase-like deaminating enzyme